MADTETTPEIPTDKKIENLISAFNQLSGQVAELREFVEHLDEFHSKRHGRLAATVRQQRQVIVSLEQSLQKTDTKVDVHIKSVTAEDIEKSLNGTKAKKEPPASGKPPAKNISSAGGALAANDQLDAMQP